MPLALAVALLVAVAAAVVGLYLLRPPPQRVPVGSAVIWARVVAGRRRLTQRLRWWLSLLLALTIALALGLALTGPESGAGRGERREFVLVVDDSATMGAWRSDGRTRLEHALELAAAEIAAGGPGARFFVADTMRAVSSGGFVDGARALEVLKDTRPVTGGAPRFPDLALLPAGKVPREVMLVSDGVAAVVPPAGTRTLSVFENAPNLGITAFSVRALPTDATRHEAFIELGNAGTAGARATVTVTGSGGPAVTRPVSVPARGFASVLVPVGAFGGGALQARVEGEADALEADDTAYAFLPFNRRLRVGLVTPGNPPLERALRLDPRLQITVLSPGAYGGRSGFDAYVFDRFTPAARPLAPVLAIRPRSAGWLPAPGPVLAAPVISSWLADQPVLENVSLADVQIDTASSFGPGGGAVVDLARTADGRTLVAASGKAPRWVATGFAIGDTNFASQASFPVFLANALQWITAEVPPQQAGIGTQRVPFERARATAMNAGVLTTREVPGATVFSLDEPDFVTVETAGARMRMLVNVLDPAITDINATTLPAEAGSPSRPSTSASPGLRLWWVLLCLAALALLLEWATYHRRVSV